MVWSTTFSIKRNKSLFSAIHATFSFSLQEDTIEKQSAFVETRNKFRKISCLIEDLIVFAHYLFELE